MMSLVGDRKISNLWFFSRHSDWRIRVQCLKWQRNIEFYPIIEYIWTMFFPCRTLFLLLSFHRHIANSDHPTCDDRHDAVVRDTWSFVIRSSISGRHSLEKHALVVCHSLFCECWISKVSSLHFAVVFNSHNYSQMVWGIVKRMLSVRLGLGVHAICTSGIGRLDLL